MPEREITLTSAELIQGAMVGVLRVIQTIQKKRKHRRGQAGYSWGDHIIGAHGEMVMAKYFNIYWSKGGIRDADVGEYQVRATEYDGGHLLICPDKNNPKYDQLLHGKGDSSDDKFFLVTGSCGSYIIRGFIMGRDAQRDDLWREFTPKRWTYAIPQSMLNTDF